MGLKFEKEDMFGNAYADAYVKIIDSKIDYTLQGTTNVFCRALVWKNKSARDANKAPFDEISFTVSGVSDITRDSLYTALKSELVSQGWVESLNDITDLDPDA